MLNFRNTSFLLLVILCLLWVLHAGWYGYLFVFTGYMLALFFGSYRVNAQFYMPVICKADKTIKQVALSFDDGPQEAYTPDILHILKQKNVTAGFFCIGNRIKAQEDLLRRIQEEGHLVGNHSFSHHPLFDLFSSRKMEKDIRAMNSETRRVLGFEPRLFRPPYGVTNPNLAKAVKKTGMIAVGWSVRSLDTVAKNEAQLFDRLLRSLHPGAIVLFHDTMQVTVNILPVFIDEARKRGYEFVRPDKLINENPYA